MNQVRRATNYSRSRTNIRTLSNSKFHQEKSYHWIFLFNNIYSFVFADCLAWWPCWAALRWYYKVIYLP